jgi:hypothetical protein
MFLSKQRLINISIVVLVGNLLWAIIASNNIALNTHQYISGWLLVGTVFFLVFYNVRKKISMVPIGSSAAWLQFHIYVGLLATLIFYLHVDWSLPNGWIETTLYILFLSICFSGIIGLYLNKILPKRLTRRGEEVIFERIPVFISQVRDEAEALAIEAAGNTSSSSIPDYYISNLANFFIGPRNFFNHLIQSHIHLINLLEDLEELERYLDVKEKEYARKLSQLVKQKDYLDYHYALQFSLKGWLFIHVPLSYGLLVFLALHITFVYAFHSTLQ